MPGPKSAKTISADKPKAPEKAKSADDAQSGKKGQKGSSDPKGSDKDQQDAKKKDPADKKKDEAKETKSWVEFQLLDAVGQPCKGEKVTIVLPDGSKKNEQTNGNGIVRVKDIEKGSGGKVTIQLANRFDYEWKFKEEKNADAA